LIHFFKRLRRCGSGSLVVGVREDQDGVGRTVEAGAGAGVSLVLGLITRPGLMVLGWCE